MLDLNDIEARLKRLYIIFNETVSLDISNHVFFHKDEYGLLTNWTIAPISSYEIDSKAISIIHQIATIKDHLKKKNYPNVEKIIDANLELQLVIDLDNADKHGYPTTSNRSKLDPQPSNIAAYPNIGPDDEVQIIREMSFGEPKHTIVSKIQVDVKGGTVVIDGDIVDGEGNKITTLQEMIRKSIEIWESIIIPK